MMSRFLIGIFITLQLAAFTTHAQEILFSENFDNCYAPAGWEIAVSNGQDAGLFFGYPINPKSDSLSIDGTCMAIFDDDLLGDNQPSFIGSITSPEINTKGYQTIRLSTDVHFRPYGVSFFTIYVIDEMGTEIPIRVFDEDDKMGNQFNNTVDFDLDLSFFTESETLRIKYEYNDAGDYAWWAGIDNVKVLGSSFGETLIQETFDDCSIPQGWSTQILEGENEWQFGEVTNENIGTQTMNGSCFAYFDDDGIGKEAPFSTAELLSPIFDGSAYANFNLELDMIFRQATDLENVSVHVFDGNSYTLVQEFNEALAGNNFYDYSSVSIDLSAFRSQQMQVVFRYDDGNSWGWWVGLDNVKIVGYGESNDICEKALPLRLGQACLRSNNTSAIYSGPSSECTEAEEGSLWFLFEAPANGTVHISNVSDYNDAISIFEGTCEQANLAACENRDEHGFDGESVFIDVVQGDSYWIRLSGVQSKFGKTRGNNCLNVAYVNQRPSPSIEDIRDQAIPLIPGEDCTLGNNSWANIEVEAPEFNQWGRSDIWFAFETEDQIDYEIISESSFAEGFNVYNREMKEVSSNQIGARYLLSDLDTSSLYYIRVSGVFASLEGQICLKVEEKAEEEEKANICTDAQYLDYEISQVIASERHNFSGLYPPCDIYIDQDSWFEFTTEENTSVHLDLNTDFVNTVAVYGDNCENPENVWCGKEINPCGGSTMISGLNPFTRYFLQVGVSSTYGNVQKGNINISIHKEPLPYAPIHK